MSFDALKEHAAQLSAKEQQRLIAYLVSLQDHANEAYREKLRAKIDDHSDANWLTLEEMDRKLGTGGSSTSKWLSTWNHFGREIE